MRLRRLTRYEIISVIVFITLCIGSIWYLMTAANMIGDVEISLHGQLARALGIGIAVILAIALNVAFIILARKQTAIEEAAEQAEQAEHEKCGGSGLKPPTNRPNNHTTNQSTNFGSLE
jgi:TRAP-type C4-dicarboxylate transport system permease small subunit